MIIGHTRLYDEYDECDAPLPALDDDDSEEELLPDEEDEG